MAWQALSGMVTLDAENTDSPQWHGNLTNGSPQWHGNSRHDNLNNQPDAPDGTRHAESTILRGGVVPVVLELTLLEQPASSGTDETEDETSG